MHYDPVVLPEPPVEPAVPVGGLDVERMGAPAATSRHRVERADLVVLPAVVPLAVIRCLAIGLASRAGSHVLVSMKYHLEPDSMPVGDRFAYEPIVMRGWTCTSTTDG